MLTKEEAQKAIDLYDRLETLQDRLYHFKEANEFTIFTKLGRAQVPVASDIARQIAYKHLNEESFDIKKQLEDMGFTWEEKDGAKDA